MTNRRFSMIRSFQLADWITVGNACCGVAAMFAAMAFLQSPWERSHLLVACGVSRLARFNVTAEKLASDEGKVAYYEGTPIPTSLVLVIVLAVAVWLERLGDELWFGVVTLGPWELHPLALLFAVSGTLMISTLRIPKP